MPREHKITEKNKPKKIEESRPGDTEGGKRAEKTWQRSSGSWIGTYTLGTSLLPLLHSTSWCTHPCTPSSLSNPLLTPAPHGPQPLERPRAHGVHKILKSRLCPRAPLLPRAPNSTAARASTTPNVGLKHIANEISESAPSGGLRKPAAFSAPPLLYCMCRYATAGGSATTAQLPRSAVKEKLELDTPTSHYRALVSVCSPGRTLNYPASRTKRAIVYSSRRVKPHVSPLSFSTPEANPRFLLRVSVTSPPVGDTRASSIGLSAL